MTNEIFKNELNTLQQFFNLYCDHKNHINKTSRNTSIIYNDKYYENKLILCNDCNSLLTYSVNKLTQCQYNPKPKCRKCPNSCYDLNQWKKVAKIMRYVGIKSKLNEIISKYILK